MTDALSLEQLRAWVDGFAASVKEHREELTELDSAIGDADHGSNMDRGLRAVGEALEAKPPADAAALFTTVGMTLVSKVGGASGPLFGTFFMRVGQALKGVDAVDVAALTAALEAGTEGVVARGKAEAGDKTMYDALAPAVAALREAGAASPGEALAAAASAARAGAEATVPLQARKGRASYLGERSIGHQDPGATSVALLLEAAAAAGGGARAT
ncbi:dihydroxyacetone kinase subunit DhaL [Nocardioides aequoreus]|uniref:dihydroxyacetone kinase subunit DhaL n=1 Tax=Nocardioides aequoreus TaxID=397278 RepID=UPI0004C32B90|nr:dihydroxyacetone kinase subunit DhaL [Nocardioides aequoreus]